MQVLVEVQTEDGMQHSLLLQNAETVRLVGPANPAPAEAVAKFASSSATPPITAEPELSSAATGASIPTASDNVDAADFGHAAVEQDAQKPNPQQLSSAHPESHAALQPTVGLKAANKHSYSAVQQTEPPLQPSGPAAGPGSDVSPATPHAAASASGPLVSTETDMGTALHANSPEAAMPNDPDITPEGFAMWRKFEMDARAATAELDAASPEPSSADPLQSAPPARTTGNSDAGTQQQPTSSSSIAPEGNQFGTTCLVWRHQAALCYKAKQNSEADSELAAVK